MFDIRALNGTGHSHRHSQNRFGVIPTPEKLSADEKNRGSGIRIAFLDSGFFPHPDFVRRVAEFHDVAGEERSFDAITAPRHYHWHGTQTVASCAGDGTLSDGVYRGIADRAELVLVKASRGGRIGDREIEDGLRWIAENRERLKIRILNISLGGDCDLTDCESSVNRLADELVNEGVVITVAAGNSEDRRPIPPASSPSVITVGGYTDANIRDRSAIELYHSSFGRTADGLVKPELVAPSMYVAAPILPGTTDYNEAEALSMLYHAPDYSFRSMLSEHYKIAGLTEAILDKDEDNARRDIETELRNRKIVAEHYQHVDGTSFAAPITASVAAQMLEANPRLSPSAVKNILISSAHRLGGQPAMRQGYGVINAELAVKIATAEDHVKLEGFLHPPHVVGSEVVFTYHNDAARTVHFAGDLNNWDSHRSPFERFTDGLWRARIPCRPAGSYRYKFVIDDTRWIDDPSHGLKDDDGFGGLNSLLLLA